jgi:hypothetical protein
MIHNKILIDCMNILNIYPQATITDFIKCYNTHSDNHKAQHDLPISPFNILHASFAEYVLKLKLESRY